MAGRTLREIKTFMDLDFLGFKNYRVIKNVFDFFSAIEQITSCQGLVGFDTETDGLNVCSMPWKSKKKNYAVGLCLSWEDDQGIYIPLRHTEFENIPVDLVVKHLFPLLETKPLATHNGIFDYKVMYDLGCKINIVHDSMLLIFNICSKVAKNSKALKNITRLLYNVTTIEFSDIFPNTEDYGKFAEIEEDVCMAYGCADPDYTRKIVLDNVDRLSDSQREAYMNDCHYIPLVAEAEYYGKPIDMVSMERDKNRCIDNIKYLEDIMYNYVGWKLTGDYNARYTFKESSQEELLDVMYKKLKYKPVDIKNKRGYKIDKFVLKKMCKEVNEDETVDEFVKTVISKNVVNLLDEDEPLIDYKKLSRATNVMAHLITTCRKQQKQLSTFFNKITNESDEETGRYYSGISMTNTETSRLVDFMQTLDGGLKYLVKVSDRAKYYMFVFDFAQIEYRVMVALACMHALVNKLDDPHTDFHVIIAAVILGLKPEQISAKMRKQFKSINFGIPYGMAVKGLVNAIYGVGLSKKEQEEAEAEVTLQLDAWCKALPEIISMLDSYRDIACTPREYEHPTIRGFENTSYVQAPDGRARIFDLKDGSKQVIGKIRRMSGNFPIQGFAATLFKLAVNNLRERLMAEGLMNVKVEVEDSFSGYGFESKVTFNGFIHDETIGFAETSVNPAYLMKLIRQECMLELVGHPTYYCGINIVMNWGEGKEGAFEAPIDFVDKYSSDVKFVEPRSDWQDAVANEVTTYCNRQSVEYVESIAGEELTENNTLDVEKVLANWVEYYYKKKIVSYGSNYRDKGDVIYTDEKGKPTDEDVLMNKLGGLLVKSGYENLVIKYKNRVDVVTGTLGDIDPVSKERELTSVYYDHMDYEGDEEDMGDGDIELTLSEEDLRVTSEKLEQTKQRNSDLLSAVLTKEF